MVPKVRCAALPAERHCSLAAPHHMFAAQRGRSMLKPLVLNTMFSKSKFDLGLLDPQKISAIRKGPENQLVYIIDGRLQEVHCADKSEQDAFFRQMERFAAGG